jgi:hypothetical protein
LKWNSRKLWLSVFTMVLIFGAFWLSGHPRELYGQMCTSLLVASGLYKAASVYEKTKA